MTGVWLRSELGTVTPCCGTDSQLPVVTLILHGVQHYDRSPLVTGHSDSLQADSADSLQPTIVMVASMLQVSDIGIKPFAAP